MNVLLFLYIILGYFTFYSLWPLKEAFENPAYVLGGENVASAQPTASPTQVLTH